MCLFRFLKIVVDRVRTIEGDFIEVMFILAISYQPTSNYNIITKLITNMGV